MFTTLIAFATFVAGFASRHALGRYNYHLKRREEIDRNFARGPRSRYYDDDCKVITAQD